MGRFTLTHSDDSARNRQSTGIGQLDEFLGGGLLPGKLTVVAGATGIGKTQLGLQFAQAGRDQEQRTGVILDLTARGDSQSHFEYAHRMFGWTLSAASALPTLDNSFFSSPDLADYLRLFEYQGRRVTRRDLDAEQWDHWQQQLNQRLAQTIAFLYQAMVTGCQRIVVDGIEPTDHPRDSIQFHLFEYVYHQVLRKDPDWVARDLFREKFRQHSDIIQQHLYDPSKISCLILCTSHEVMLDDLIARPLHEGDILSNANTVIYMGKTRHGHKMGRAMAIAKHRGSPCRDEMIPYRIGPQGIELE